MRADYRTLPAEAAGIDQFIGGPGTLHNGLIIVYLADQCLRIFLEFPQIDTLFDAFQAFAVDASAGLLPGTISGVAGGRISGEYLSGRGNSRSDRVHSGGSRSFLVPLGGE